MNSGLHDGRPKVEMDFPCSSPGKLVGFLSLAVLGGICEVSKVHCWDFRAYLYVPNSLSPLHHAFLYCVMLVWLSVAFTLSTDSQPPDGWCNHHALYIFSTEWCCSLLSSVSSRGWLSQKEISLYTSLDYALGFPQQRRSMESWLPSIVIHLHLSL